MSTAPRGWEAAAWVDRHGILFRTYRGSIRRAADLTSSANHGSAVCLVSLSHPQEATLERLVRSQGACWAGGLPDILTRPRLRFPPDRSYRAVSVNLEGACALDRSGDAYCCTGGATPLPPFVPGPFSKVSLGEGDACGLRKDRSLTCWGADDKGRATPPSGRFVDLSLAREHACAIGVAGDLTCWGAANPQDRFRPSGRGFTRVVTDAWISAVERRDGRVVFWDTSSATELNGRYRQVELDWPSLCLVDRKTGAAFTWASHRLAPAHPGPFFRATCSAEGHGCGLSATGQLTCWGMPASTAGACRPADWSRSTVGAALSARSRPRDSCRVGGTRGWREPSPRWGLPSPGHPDE